MAYFTINNILKGLASIEKDNPYFYEQIKDEVDALKEKIREVENSQKLKGNFIFPDVMEYIYTHLQENDFLSESHLETNHGNHSLRKDNFSNLFDALHDYAVQRGHRGQDYTMLQHFKNYGFNLLYKDMKIAVRTVYGVDTTVEYIKYTEQNRYVEWEDYMVFSFDSFMTEQLNKSKSS